MNLRLFCLIFKHCAKIQTSMEPLKPKVARQNVQILNVVATKFVMDLLVFSICQINFFQLDKRCT